ncbi:MAG: hypothetical protein ACW98W_07460 [Candidatus Hodarchaeales archaeon]|jgi:hypothetical protein
MSQIYRDVLNKFKDLQEIMKLEEKEFKKNQRKTATVASILVIASLYSKYPLERQFRVFQAMKQSMKEELDNYKALGDSVDVIAAYLIYAAEINKNKP